MQSKFDGGKLKLSKLLLKKKYGLLNPSSITFSVITVPSILLILTFNVPIFKDFLKKYLNIEIFKLENVNDYFKDKNIDSVIEIKIVYLIYFILCQMIIPAIVDPLNNQINLKEGKFLNLTIFELPNLLFDIFSLIIIPKMIVDYFMPKMTFQWERYKKVSIRIIYYSVIFGMIGLNNIWNYVNVFISFIFTIFMLYLLELDANIYYPSINLKNVTIFLQKKKIKEVFYSLFGLRFPDKEKYSEDYFQMTILLGIFCFTLISTFSKYIPFYYYLLGYELNFIEIIVKILLSIVLPIMLRNLGTGKIYEDEIFLLGNMISILLPLFYYPIYYYLTYNFRYNHY